MSPTRTGRRGGARQDGDSALFDDSARQYRRSGDGGEADVVVGLDFGTSASKVVIQVHGVPGTPAYAVDFREMAHASMPYLLPTQLWISEDGLCVLSPQNGARRITDLKLELFSTEKELQSNHGPTRQGLSPEVTAVAYLALLLRYARTWLLEEKRAVIGHLRRLNWGMNLGIPSPHARKDEKNCRFERVGKAAWMLSVLEAEITLDKAREELQHLTEVPEYWDTDEDACDLQVVPEIAAGAIGYALSENHREGLHLMVDVGASTIDVCSFLLYEKEQNRQYGLLTAGVRQYGTIRLHQERIRAIRSAYSEKAQELRDNHDPLAPIAKDLDAYLLSREQLEAAVCRAENELKELCQKVIRRVIIDLRTIRDPMSSAWKSRLPILFIGGGSQSPFFRALVEEMDTWLRARRYSEGARFPPVEVPATIGKNPEERHRVAVAWGLSHQEFNIGEIIPFEEIEDIAPPRHRDWEGSFVRQEDT